MAVADARYPGKIQRVFVHFPLTMHRFARPAAVAAECADRQGKFGAMRSVLFAKQDSLGLKSWASYGVDASINDTTALAACIATHRTFPRIEAGVREAARLEVQATPTVIVNGWRFAVPPTDSVMTETINALLLNKTPPAAERTKKS